MALSFTSHKPKPGRKPAARPVGAAKAPKPAAARPAGTPKEIGGPEGPEPTRYGDWERKGICVDF